MLQKLCINDKMRSQPKLIDNYTKKYLFWINKRKIFRYQNKKL